MKRKDHYLFTQLQLPPTTQYAWCYVAVASTCLKSRFANAPSMKMSKQFLCTVPLCTHLTFSIKLLHTGACILVPCTCRYVHISDYIREEGTSITAFEFDTVGEVLCNCTLSTMNRCTCYDVPWACTYLSLPIYYFWAALQEIHSWYSPG